MLAPDQLLSRIDLDAAAISERPRVERRLSDLAGVFADSAAYELAVSRENSLVYAVSSVEPGAGEGDLHYGLGMIMPGRIGDEYWQTKGHLHAWRPAAELYVGLRGEGAMLLEDETTGQSRLVPLLPQALVYVPGHTAHRTVNTGSEPLLYLGIYPARAGHDYASIATRNFRHVVAERGGRPTLVPREEYQR